MLARHVATFTKFCDTGSVAGGDCWCQGGADSVAIGDGSWLWQAFSPDGGPCEARAGDRCDCESCGGEADSCPGAAAAPDCWQCQGVLPPQCNVPPLLERCEVTLLGAVHNHNVTLYVNEVCPAAHPCNRCKPRAQQRCAEYEPLHMDVCASSWAAAFGDTPQEATATWVTLSCFPHERPDAAIASCESDAAVVGPYDLPFATCDAWCDEAFAGDHCQHCRCRGCEHLRCDEYTACSSSIAGDTPYEGCEGWCSTDPAMCSVCKCRGCAHLNCDARADREGAAQGGLELQTTPCSSLVPDDLPYESCESWCDERAANPNPDPGPDPDPDPRPRPRP